MDNATEIRIHEILAERLKTVEARIEAACRRTGRQCSEVTLVAVTKTVGPEIAGLLPSLGVLDLGESRPQELWRKAALLPKEVRWHQVGHLQRNKIQATLPLAYLIHSVDSVRLLAALDEEAGKQNRKTEVLLEINVSGETQKHGFRPDELAGLMEPIADLKHVQVSGLMTMAPLEADPECSRPTFAGLRALRDEWCKQMPPDHYLVRLSMGMTNDFEVAIEEGATIVRLGTILFEGLSKPQ
jgi:pyridoxal phosphate enzyme (YggS family)